MPELSVEEKREFLIVNMLKVWNDPENEAVPIGKKVVDSLTKIMVFVGNYKDFTGADKKEEALAILELLLKKTDSPGPDFVVDAAILWIAEAVIDALYDAFKGEFDFDGSEQL